MTTIFCFTEYTEPHSDLLQFLESLDEKQFEVQLYTDVAASDITAKDIAIAMNAPEQETAIVCMTDMLSLLHDLYTLFPFAADGYLFYHTFGLSDFSFQSDCIFVPIFTNNALTLDDVKNCIYPLSFVNHITKFNSSLYEAYRYLSGFATLPASNITAEALEEAANLLDNFSDLCQSDSSIFYFIQEFMQFLLNSNITYISRLLYLSFSIHTFKNPEDYNALMQFAMQETVLTPLNRYFLWFQLRRLPLLYPLINAACEQTASYRLYKQIYDTYQQSFSDYFVRIPKEERNKDLIFVFTTAFLHERHAPTRTVLERCYTLGKLLGKKIVLIHTKEYSMSLGMLPFYQSYLGNTLESYNIKDTYTYKDYTFPFFQPSAKMPDYDTICALISMLLKHKPYFILSIGAGSLTADICSNIVPVLSMSVTFSTFPVSISPLWILGRNLKPEDSKYLQAIGYDQSNIIESRFTFDLIEKHSVLTRKDYHIPEDCFLMAVIGLRLDSEITDSFIHEMCKLLCENVYMVFAGHFKQYEQYCNEYPAIKQFTIFIGFCDDIPALMDICDLYINPPRIGGGFSIIEAFSRGVPGITMQQGDVAASAGDEFCVRGYTEMHNIILRYMKDAAFYKQMSKKAAKRAELMTNSSLGLSNILSALNNYLLFY